MLPELKNMHHYYWPQDSRAYISTALKDISNKARIITITVYLLRVRLRRAFLGQDEGHKYFFINWHAI